MLKYLLLLILLLFAEIRAQTFDANTNTLHATIPEGITLKECEYGFGLFATKAFKAGETIYKSRFVLVSTQEKSYILKTDLLEFMITTSIHTVGIDNDQRALYTFDSFINHSCDPNSRSYDNDEMSAQCEYMQIATRDINIGDEINCDYNLFDYDCSDKYIDDCRCGTKACRKSVKGFKSLPLSDQISLLPYVDSNIFRRFLDDHPNFIYIEDLKIPSTVTVIKNGIYGKIVSNYDYKAGDVIYENQTLLFKEYQTILIKLNGEFMLIENPVHTVRRGNSEREFYYFDSFMNHSCDPNTITFYLSPNDYQGIALRSIAVGEELTCDYGIFDDNPDGEGFQCQCGAENCRGWVY